METHSYMRTGLGLTLSEQQTTGFEEALENTLSGRYDQQDIIRLLEPQDEGEKQQIFSEARRLRNKNFRNGIYLYGFVYFSTICRNNCRFCYYRKTNNHPERYRKNIDEIKAISRRFLEEGVHLLDLTSGEDPYYHDNFKRFLQTVREVDKLGSPIMISPGVLTEKQLELACEAGADWYALYQETHSEELYRDLRPKQPYRERIQARENALEQGMLTEDGMLLGVGETKQDIAQTIIRMSQQDTGQVRCMKYVKQKGIPIPQQESPTNYSNVIAVLRLTNPNKLIPASLDINGLEGIEKPLKAGANVVTSLVIEDLGLKGVAQHEYGIDSGERSPKSVINYLRENGYKINKKKNLERYIEKNQKKQ